jgi:ABC-2 type transport system ATP-binding protein
VLSAGRIQVAATVDSLLDTHLALTGPADGVDDLYDQVEIVTAQRAGRQAVVLARTGAAPPGYAAPPGWAGRPVTMEELVLGYLREPAARVAGEPGLEIVR